ncbi:MucR family transcriptional regulator [Micromonospora sp. STR1s_5]|nr:MucR family transcriptional regulator [Micromonospora sp. STR1s_5]
MSESASSNSTQELVELTAEIVSAYVGNNTVQMSDLPNVIAGVHSALQNLGRPEEQPNEKPTPLMPIKKTITPDFLISLEDGGRYKTLRRHLTRRGLTPEQYREKWGLPRDYPMVAASYAAKRSELAKAAGLGQARAGTRAKSGNRGRARKEA